MLIFWERVKEILDYKSRTQKELAAEIGESYNTLQSWINRDRLPNAEQAVKIAVSLNTSVEFLVNGKKPIYKTDYAEVVQLLNNAIKKLEA